MAEYATVFEEKKQMTRRFALVTSFCLAGAVLLSAGLPARSNAAKDDVATPAMKAVAGQGMLGSHAFEFLTELTDDIGARVSGTPAAARAVDWGLAKMKAMGLENVHPEKWQLSRGWTRVSAEAELLTPTPRHLTIDSLGWVGSTAPGGVEAEVVPFNLYDFDNEIEKNSSHWAGKVLLVMQKGAPPKDARGLFVKFGGSPS